MVRWIVFLDQRAHIYQEIRATDMRYKNRVRSRISNLKDPKNPGLRRNVLAGYIEMTRIASMSAEVWPVGLPQNPWGDRVSSMLIRFGTA